MTGHVWDEVLGAWVPEVAPYQGAPSDYSIAAVVSEHMGAPSIGYPLSDLIDEEAASRRDFTREILSSAEFAAGGFSVNKPDAAFMARVQAGEDRSTDTGQAATQAAFSALRAALTAYQDAPDPALRADQARALAMRVEDLFDALGME